MSSRSENKVPEKSRSKYSSMRLPTPTRLSTDGDYRGPERRIKEWPFAHIPSSQSCILFYLTLHLLSWTWAAASDCNGAQAIWRCRPWEVYDRHHDYDTYCTLCCISLPRPSPDPALAQHARSCFCTQASRITVEGCLRLSRGVGERRAGGVPVDATRYFSTQISPSRFHPRRLIQHMGAWANLADATIPCLHARV